MYVTTEKAATAAIKRPYRVIYQRDGRVRSQRFARLGQAEGFRRRLPFGSNGRTVYLQAKQV